MKVTAKGVVLAGLTVLGPMLAAFCVAHLFVVRGILAGDCGISEAEARSEARNFVMVHSTELGLSGPPQRGTLKLVSATGSCSYDYEFSVDRQQVDVTVYDNYPQTRLSVTSGALDRKPHQSD